MDTVDKFHQNHPCEGTRGDEFETIRTSEASESDFVNYANWNTGSQNMSDDAMNTSEFNFETQMEIPGNGAENEHRDQELNTTTSQGNNVMADIGECGVADTPAAENRQSLFKQETKATVNEVATKVEIILERMKGFAESTVQDMNQFLVGTDSVMMKYYTCRDDQIGEADRLRKMEPQVETACEQMLARASAFPGCVSGVV